MNIIIDIDRNKNFFYLKGDIKSIELNRPLRIRLNRFSPSFENDYIKISYVQENKIKTLNDIHGILDKFNYNVSNSSLIETVFDNYFLEEKQFEIFSQKAKQIRNNEFNLDSSLISEFELFKEVLEKNLTRTLYPLQLLSAFHMAFSQHSCNFAVPGAGKTSIVYGAYAFLKSLPEDNPKYVNKLVVIGPLSSFAPWENEFEACFGVPVNSFRMSGNVDISKDLKEQHLYSSNPKELTLIFHGGVPSYENDILDFLKRNKTMVVVDEAHRIKNPEGVWGKSVTNISKEAKSRIVLTGTPVPNGYQDIFNLYKFIYPFKHKSIIDFHYHNLEDMTKNSELGSERVQRLKENLSPYFIRIKKSDLKLPTTKEKTIYVEMNNYQREIYDFIESKYIEDFKESYSGTVKDILNKAKLIRLRQASSNPALLGRPLQEALESGEYEKDPNSEFTTDNALIVNDSDFFNKILEYPSNEIPVKFVKIYELLQSDIFRRNEKVIIWTIFVQNAKALKSYLKSHNLDSKLLIGEIPQEEREITIRKFNDPENNEFNIVIANPFAVAESISLHKGCHNAIYMERDYNCASFLQSKDRIHRVGLPENTITTYYYIISKNSIDEIIDKRLNKKVERMEKIINDDIPLFSIIDDSDETDIIKDLVKAYAGRI